MFPDSLDRFRLAQQSRTQGLSTALAELAAGRKTSHWMWYIFPQLPGLGASQLSQFYAVELPEAERYLEDPLLRSGLLQVVAEVHRQSVEQCVSLVTLLGSSVDARKLVSSLTLWRAVAGRHLSGVPAQDLAQLRHQGDAILAVARQQQIPRCAFTEDLIDRAGWGISPPPAH
jgi:uncharacterized protein (DUF1810 family)